ncbi:MAG: hypothetical protein O3C21_19305 [Verrucomicrobia bacterium]|nr:hypothetical protein [Verrucomicrobiota bacterium]
MQKRRNDTTSANCTNYFADGEARCSSGTVTKYFYTRDHLGSVYELTNTSRVAPNQVWSR